MKMVQPMGHCEQCGTRASEGETLHTISNFSWSYRGVNCSQQNGGVTYTSCSSLECQLALHSQMVEDLKEQVAKNKTNAVGPTAPGAPGCAFNEHFQKPEGGRK